MQMAMRQASTTASEAVSAVGHAAPGWYQTAIAAQTQSRYLNVSGARIHYRIWQDASAPGAADAKRGLVFVHGSAAHSHWWDHIAPCFGEDHSLAALDLSGMGESDSRQHYDIETYAAELAAILLDSGFCAAGRPKPIIVAHSFGAFVAAHAAHRHSDRFGGLIIVDSHLAVPEGLRRDVHFPFIVSPRHYASAEEALARFRLIPPQPSPNPYIVQRIAQHSLKQTEAGWTWKFDGSQFAEGNVGTDIFYSTEALLREISIPAAIIHGSESVLVNAAIARHTAACFGSAVPVIEIPGGHHHLMIDQPVALIAAIRALLAAGFAAERPINE